MPFKEHNQAHPTADPVLLQISDAGEATFSDGSKLQFPPGTTFRPHPYPENIKLVMVVTPPKQGDRQPTEFKVIQGATRGSIETAIRRCEQGV